MTNQWISRVHYHSLPYFQTNPDRITTELEPWHLTLLKAPALQSPSDWPLPPEVMWFLANRKKSSPMTHHGFYIFELVVSYYNFWVWMVLPCFTISFYTHVLWFFMVLPWAHPKAAQRRSTEPGSWRSRRRGGDFPYDETGAAKQFAIWSPMGLGGTGKMYKNVGSTHIIIFNKFHNTNSIYFHNQAWELQNVHRKVRSLPQAATTALMWKTLTSACAAQSATMNFKTRFLMWSTAFWYSNV